MKKQILFDQWIGEAWKNAKDKIWFWVGLLLLVSLIPNIPSWLEYAVDNNTPSAVATSIIIVATVLSVFLSIVVSLGQIRIFLNQADGKKLTYIDLYQNYKLFWKFFGASILYGLIVIGGFILLIVPGIVWSLRFQFAPWLVVEKKLGPIAALKESARITNSNMWSILAVNTIAGMITIIGLCALLIGIFWAYPTKMILQTRLYRLLSEQSNE